MSIKTSLIMSAMAAISASFIPRVVQAGVPSRMPLAWNGDRVSNGIVFLFVVMPASSSAIWQSLPVKFFRAHIHEHEMIVRAAADERKPLSLHAVRQRRRVLDDLLLIGFERRLQRFVETHRLARDDVHQRPALDSRERLRINFLRILSPGTESNRRAARATSCASWS
jgi:hypothetical protein